MLMHFPFPVFLMVEVFSSLDKPQLLSAKKWSPADDSAKQPAEPPERHSTAKATIRRVRMRALFEMASLFLLVGLESAWTFWHSCRTFLFMNTGHQLSQIFTWSTGDTGIAPSTNLCTDLAQYSMPLDFFCYLRKSRLSECSQVGNHSLKSAKVPSTNGTF